MNVLIVEDELNAFEYLSKILLGIDPDIKILGNEDSVKGTLNFLQTNDDLLDLIFMDIQLSDGLSFEIFNHIDLQIPVIFTTAFDQYAIDAFKVYSVDYLLKPIHQDDLAASLNRYKNLYAKKIASSDNIDFLKMMSSFNKPMKNRCLVKRGGHYEYVDVEMISYVYSEDSITFLVTTDAKRHIYSKTIEALFSELDPKYFFQINRSQILHINSIKEIHPYLNQRMKVNLSANLKVSEEFIVSRNRMLDFKNWLDQ
jgi:DNA-binding LytR/AlgR family response regulator